MAAGQLGCLPAFVDEEFAFISKSSDGDDIGVIIKGSKRKTWETATASVSAWETCDAIAIASIETASNLWSQKNVLVDPTTSPATLRSRKRKANAEDAADQPTKEYIYVRARRGQATDRHSLAERARRKEIGRRMMLLQSIVPGCDQITGRAGVLDAIINYIQSLQQQVEALSSTCSAVWSM